MEKDVENVVEETVGNVNTYKVELLDKSKKKGDTMAQFSMIFAFIALAGAVLSLIFGVLSFIFAGMVFPPFIHVILFSPILVIAILSIIFASIAKKKGNVSGKRKVGKILGILSAIVLALSIVLMLVLGIFWLFVIVLVVIFGAAAITVIETIIGVLITISPALAPILGIVGPILIAAVPTVLGIFAQALAPDLVDMLMEFIRSLLGGGVIIFTIV